MLVDHAVIFVQGGKGGNGVVSFRREAYVPKGGPDGGDGGDGGSVYLEAAADVDTLLDMAGRHHWRAEDGRPGQGKSRFGRSGRDLVIRVPPGTVVHDDETGEVIDDLNEVGKRVLVAAGGDGGFGNEHFKGPTNQTPRTATPGEPGRQRRLRLELKLIADVGLIGLPNAGKSTLLSRISAARPKIADYPFTTLEPQLGIADLPGYRRLVFADIPGLIAGASHGAGLGHEFLRHIERTRMLVHLVELEPVDGGDPVANYHAIRRELADYAPALAAKPEIIAISKVELLGDQSDIDVAVSMIQDALDRPVLAVSAATGYGIERLLDRCWEEVRQMQD